MSADFSLQIEQSLRMLGFSRHEITVLIYLFRNKRADSKTICQETAIVYSMVQTILGSLSRRNIIIPPKAGGNYYTFAGEKYFFEWLQEEKQRHTKIYEEAESDIKTFFQVTKQETWHPEVLYYEGKEGIKEIYEDMLAEGENIYCWTDSSVMYELLEDYIPHWVKEREQKKIKSYAIMPKNKINLEHQKSRKDYLVCKLVERMGFEGQIRIYGNKVALMTFSQGKAVGFVFKGNLFSKLFKSVFDGFWNNLG